MVCITAIVLWTESLALDYVKFDARRSLLEEAARNLRQYQQQGMSSPAAEEKL
jgi:hypothetical protein